MAGFDIWDTFTLHTLHFLDTLKSVSQTMFTRLLSFYVHRVEALDHVVFCNGCKVHGPLLIWKWNGEGKD